MQQFLVRLIQSTNAGQRHRSAQFALSISRARATPRSRSRRKTIEVGAADTHCVRARAMALRMSLPLRTPPSTERFRPRR